MNANKKNTIELKVYIMFFLFSVSSVVKYLFAFDPY